MKPIRILHTSDFHMDSPFESLSDGKAAIWRAELRQLPQKIARLAVAERADLVLLCGDLLDSDSAFKETGEELIDSLRMIPVPVFIAPGNHDYYHEKAVYASEKIPDNIFIFRKNSIEYYDFPEKGFRIYGAGFIDRYSSSLMNDFHAARVSGIVNIMCLHGEVDNPQSSYNPITKDQIKESGLDYLALGHVHKASGLKNEGNTFYSYSGCPEGRGFDETGEKTVNIIDLEEGKCTLRTIPVAARKYEQISVDISERDPLLSIQLALPDDTIKDIFRITLKGETEKSVSVHEIYKQIADLFFELHIEDRTTLKNNIWETGGENTLRGSFLTKMRERYDKADNETDKEKIEMAVRWGIAAIDNCEEIVVHEDQ